MVASVALHAGGALAATSLGHPSAPVGAPATTEFTVEVEAAPLPAPPLQAEPPEPPAQVPSVAARTPHPAPAHTHSYPVPRSHDERPHDPGLVHLPGGSAHPAPEAPSEERPVAEAPAPPKFSLSLGPAVGHGPAQGTAGAPGPAAVGGGPLPESAVSRGARLVSRAGVQYPAEARAAEVEASVALEIVVDRQGAVAEARVVRAAGYGFDAAALLAIKQYRFAPAERNGELVPVRMRWTVDFRLH